MLRIHIQARSQPARWGGGSELGWVEHQAHPPPLDIVRVTSSTYSKGGTKLLKGGTKLLKGGTKLLKGGTKLLKGGTKLLKGGTKLLKGGTKLLKGGTKLLKGGTKSLGWATGGVVRPPRPPRLRPDISHVKWKFHTHKHLHAYSRDANLPPNGGNPLFFTKILTPEIRLNPQR